MEKLQASALRFLFKAISLLPLRGLQAIGGFLGRCTWWLQGREAKITLRNIELCLPELTESERLDLAQRSLVETGKLGLEMVKVWMQPAAKSLASLQQGDYRDELARLADGRGIIVVAPHLSNWEVLNLFLGRNFNSNILYQPPKLQALEAIMADARAKTGSKVFPTNRRGVAAMFNALRKGELVGILPDQEPELEGGVFVDFFGVQALTMTLVSKLAQKTGAAVVFGYALRLPGGTGFRLQFRPADSDIYSDDLETSVAALNAGVEACVRAAPAQYQWEYKRFRRAADGSRTAHYKFKK